MNGFSLIVAFAVAAIASGSVYGNYPSAGYAQLPSASADYQLQGVGSSGDGTGANAAASANSLDSGSLSNAGPNLYGSNQNIPYSAGNTRGNSLTSSITYPQNKGEILIHRPAAIIVKRPPTKVLVNHPPLVVKPAPVVLHKPPAVVLRKVFVKQYPRPVKVEPVYVNVVKPPAEKYFVNEKQALAAGYERVGAVPVGGPSAATVAGINGSPAYSPANNAAANAGYRLLSGQGGYNQAY